MQISCPIIAFIIFLGTVIEVLSTIAREMVMYLGIVGKFECAIQSKFVLTCFCIKWKAAALSDIEGELQTASSAIADDHSIIEFQSGASDLLFNLRQPFLHPTELGRTDALLLAHRIVFN